MTDRPQKPGDRPVPPVLQRAPAPGPPRGGATGVASAPGPGGAPGASRGLAAPEVTAAAAIAAGLASEGSLARQSPFHLYYLAAAAQASGRLVLASDLATYGLTFKRGVVEHASSTWPQDDLGEFLVRRGAVGAGQAADARELAPRLGGDLLAALVELRLLDPAARFADLQEHGAGLVWRALATEVGTWRWEPAAPAPAFAFPLGSRWGLLCDAVRRLDAAAAARRLGDRAGRMASRIGGRVEIAELRLNPQEARVSALFEGGLCPDEMAVFHAADADVVRRVALLLAETELLAFGAPRAAAPPPPASPAAPPARAPEPPPAAGPARPGETVVPPPGPARPAPAVPGPPATTPAPGRAAAPPVAARPAGPRPAAPAPPPRPAATHASPRPGASRPAAPAAPPAPTVESLRAMLKQVRDGDHFQVLGVIREAEPARIKTAYFQLARTYHPDAAREGESDEAKQLRADVFARIGAAWAVLEDDTRRAAYLEELKSGGATEVDISVIFRSEEVFRTVEPLVKARSYAEALKRVNEAIAMYAEEPEYHVWKAWIEFLIAPDGQKKAQRMMSDRAIEAALRKSPKCKPGYRFLGLMAKLTGDIGAAERQLKRGLAELPDDAELLQELRYLKK